MLKPAVERKHLSLKTVSKWLKATQRLKAKTFSRKPVFKWLKARNSAVENKIVEFFMKI